MALKKRKHKTTKSQPQTTQCVLCAKKPDLAKLITKAWLDGQQPDTISRKFGIKLSIIETHITRCVVNKHRSRYDKLKLLLDNLFADIDIARKLWHAVGDKDTSASYQGLLHEFRGLLSDLQKVQSAEEQIDELVDLAINPLIVQLTKVIARESENLREELSVRIDATEAANTVKEFTDAVGEQFSELIPELRERLENVLTAKDKNRKHVLSASTASFTNKDNAFSN